MKGLILLLLFTLALGDDHIDTTLGTTEANPASSCAEIYELNSASRGTIGQYMKWSTKSDMQYEAKVWRP